MHSSHCYFVLFILQVYFRVCVDTEISPHWVLHEYSGKGNICHGVCVTQTSEVNKRRRWACITNIFCFVNQVNSRGRSTWSMSSYTHPMSRQWVTFILSSLVYFSGCWLLFCLWKLHDFYTWSVTSFFLSLQNWLLYL